MDDRRARELVAAERQRIEAAISDLSGEVRDGQDLESQQEGESDAGGALASELVDDALLANLRVELEAVVRAEGRIDSGTYGLSIDSGAAIPDARLESQPLAERTIEEQRVIDAAGR